MAQFREAMEKSSEQQDKLRDEVIKQIKKVLNKSQETTYAKIVGKPYDILKLAQNLGNAFGGRGGGDTGGRGGRGGRGG
jgi:hypothetical protein